MNRKFIINRCPAITSYIQHKSYVHACAVLLLLLRLDILYIAAT